MSQQCRHGQRTGGRATAAPSCIPWAGGSCPAGAPAPCQPPCHPPVPCNSCKDSALCCHIISITPLFGRLFLKLGIPDARGARVGQSTENKVCSHAHKTVCKPQRAGTCFCTEISERGALQLQQGGRQAGPSGSSLQDAVNGSFATLCRGFQ